MEIHIVIGHVGRVDPMRFTPGGLKVTNFTVASNRTRQNDDEVTTWYRCAAWGDKFAPMIAENLTKGRLVYVRGELPPEPRIWVGDDGQSRCQYELSVREFKFLDKKPVAAPGDELAHIEEDEIPF